MIARVLGFAALAVAVVLLVWDVVPGRFPARAHDVLGALPLVVIAIAWLIYRRKSAFPQAVVLAVAFLFWAANQFWPNAPYATLYNDIAIALFVLDVCLAMRSSTT